MCMIQEAKRRIYDLEERCAHLETLLRDLIDDKESVVIYPSAIEQNDWGTFDFEEWEKSARRILDAPR